MTNWAALIGSVIGTAGGIYGSGQADKAQRQAADKAAASSDRQFQQTRQDMAPWMSAGTATLSEQRRQLGLDDYQPGDVSGIDTDLQLVPGQMVGDNPLYVDANTGDTFLIGQSGANKGQVVPLNRKLPGFTPKPRATSTTGGAASPNSGSRYGAFETSPGYLFRMDEGTRAIDRTQASRGRSYSGAALREAARYASGLASQEYDSYYQRLAGLSGTGQSAVNATNVFGANNAANQGTAQLLSGASRASGIANQYDIFGQGVRDIGGILGDWSRGSGGSGGGANGMRYPGEWS